MLGGDEGNQVLVLALAVAARQSGQIVPFHGLGKRRLQVPQVFVDGCWRDDAAAALAAFLPPLGNVVVDVVPVLMVKTTANGSRA